MKFWQRTLVLATILGVSVTSQETESHLVRVIEKLDILTNALQYQDNLLLDLTIKMDDLVGAVERHNQTLNDLPDTVHALGVRVDTNHLATTTHLDTITSGMQWDAFRIGDAPLRLVGSGNRGRLEVFHNQLWGTVCDDYFNDDKAVVFCRALGLPHSQAKAIQSYGGGSGLIYLDNVQCPVSHDARLCLHGGWGVEDCTHSEDVGLECR